MYTVTVPIINDSLTAETRDIYLHQIRESRIDRVLLVLFGYGATAEDDKPALEGLKENIAFLTEAGVDVGVWIGMTIGHGGPLAITVDQGHGSPYSHLVNLKGEEIRTASCPLDEAFRRRIGEVVSDVAKTGARLILLDDDFRMSQHGPEWCCACDKHLALIRTYCGEPVEREELKTLAFSGPANKYRDAWMEAQSEGLSLLARDIRRAADAVSTETRVGFCTAHAVWGIDGADPVKLAYEMAGENKPLLRLHGAPYWSQRAGIPMPHVIEMARLLAWYCRGSGCELMAEGDVYPRPRYHVPSSLLEMYDAIIRIDGGYDGILKYMVDYNASPLYETGYLVRHRKNLSKRERLAELFEGKRALGVNVTVERGLLARADFSIDAAAGKQPWPVAGALLATSSIPTVYGEGGICHALVGESARVASEDMLAGGCVIDAVAAEILRQGGVDVGLSSPVGFDVGKVTFLKTLDEKDSVLVDATDTRYASFSLCDGASACAYALVGGKKIPFAYRYENARGERFLVLGFDAAYSPRNTGLYRGYLQQKILSSGIEWISGKKLPAFIPECPDLYTVCKGDENGMAVAFFNFFADTVEDPVVYLDKTYKEVEFLGCEGRLEGDRVILSSAIPAYSFVAFSVR